MEPPSGLDSFKELKTGDGLQKQEHPNGAENIVTQIESPVTEGGGQRRARAGGLTGVHRRKEKGLFSKPIHDNNTSVHSPSSLQFSLSSSSVPTSLLKTLQTQDNQGSSELQASESNR
jgi:hypothetical protein